MSINLDLMRLLAHLFFLALSFVCTTTAMAQQPTAQADGWRGLVIDVSTADERATGFGKTEKR